MASLIADSAIFCPARCASQKSAWPRTRGLESLCATLATTSKARGSLFCVNAKMACSRILSHHPADDFETTLATRVAQPKNGLTADLFRLVLRRQLFKGLIGGRIGM